MARQNRKPISRFTKHIVWDKTAGRCWYCGWHINPFVNFAVDHVMPVSRGGTDDIENLRPSCSACNTEKATMTVDEYRDFMTLMNSGYPYLFWGERPGDPDEWD